jgi:hypothetical protein
LAGTPKGLVVGNGPNLTWLDPHTGDEIETKPAGVKSSWIYRIFTASDDAFIAMGYDDPKITRWKMTERAPEREATFDQRHADGRYARSYGATISATGDTLYVAHWNECIEIIDAQSLQLQAIIDTAGSYAVLAVNPQQTHLWAASGSQVFLYDLASGHRLAHASLSAEVKALSGTGRATAVAGLSNGELHVLSWPVG